MSSRYNKYLVDADDLETLDEKGRVVKPVGPGRPPSLEARRRSARRQRRFMRMAASKRLGC